MEKFAPSLDNWTTLFLLVAAQGLFIVFITSYLFYCILKNTSFFTIFQDYFIALTMSLCVYAIGYLGYARPHVLAGKTVLRKH